MSGDRRSAWTALVALALTLVVSVYYLMTGVLQVRPLAATYRVTVQLSESGGLLPNQDVTMRGVRVGKVERLAFTPGGVEAVLRVSEDARIPAASSVRVSALSAAGEQYVDFAATSEDGPYLSDGAVITRDRTAVPVSMAELLANADGVLAQVDPQKLERMKAELSLSSAGPEKLAAIVDGGTFLLSTLDSVLPETVGVIRSSRVVLSSAVDVNNGIGATATNLRHTMAGVAGMQDGYRRLLGQSPAALGAIDNVFTDNSDTMVQLLGNLATVARLSYVRVPALDALFPDYRGSALEAFISTMHEHGLWVTADIYPRYACDYGTPRRPPSAADYPEPNLYTYCHDDDPSLLVRGARNAPRPAGDDTAGPPPGADLATTADPTPPGRYTIPTPYGGPTLPIEPPR
ncbi:MlaD family protein [Mycobacterium syngnathidarum]|uniref:Mammalian cell entry protein n=1 Tax=Mycobacterium syngnathidarum TaxID=1908205 RepID=A0A1S1KGB5_9MYCO|nr:mammalian cell entry protein [Mycobacterium syngnathidarum]OLT98325.1 mammalian cell entry protein [Mycobacterium syngnathidarum]